tara:strand:- start:87 stop:587 length:501 start_codon:yes stop_codon:yes gene_type:complete
MSRKNKKKNITEARMDAIEEVMEKHVEEAAPAEKPLKLAVDKTVHALVTKTAIRNKLPPKVLVDTAVEAMYGSLESYGYKCLEANNGNRKATSGSINEGKNITLSEESRDILNATGLYFGVSMCELLRDAILGQRYNWQRMQPVNARTMSSIRMQMFELEQLGPRN